MLTSLVGGLQTRKRLMGVYSPEVKYSPQTLPRQPTRYPTRDIFTQPSKIEKRSISSWRVSYVTGQEDVF